MKKNGFTLVELLAVIMLLIIVVMIATYNLTKTYSTGKKRALLDEALVMSEGAINKYNDDRLDKDYKDDLYRGRTNVGKFRCYSIKTLIGQYVKKYDKKYTGSVEVCYGDGCEVKTKIWLTDGDKYLNGVEVDGYLDYSDISDTKLTEHFNSCGWDISEIKNEYLYNYTGKEEVFTSPNGGTYLVEVWGAEGGAAYFTHRACAGSDQNYEYLVGGKGGYSRVKVDLEPGHNLYINVGGKGSYFSSDEDVETPGGYNGGGKGNYYYGAGGGASSVAFKSGPLTNLELIDIVTVAGGGGGAYGSRGCDGYANGTNGGGNCSSYGVCFENGNYGFRDNAIGVGGGLYTSTSLQSHYGGTGYISNPVTYDGSTCYYTTDQSDTNRCSYSIDDDDNESDKEKPVTNGYKNGNGFVKIKKL